ncbi:hypothetical protein BU25DRAFT_406481 [Macroventuria anomochaeta]|uniref:Uncharacterized protein n=1 Tax=Macroventuria anomochaeta TaxID=301207 RepID=A0ACB6SF47_9PLEO|nr:uncharacterized protein BU25DRAFT_406481 [Macroventuria anomochaeta]KAF2631958.1 hypothetical protein BU25DRAFT_406481 [Macroventuria anomochaeta]
MRGASSLPKPSTVIQRTTTPRATNFRVSLSTFVVKATCVFLIFDIWLLCGMTHSKCMWKVNTVRICSKGRAPRKHKSEIASSNAVPWF